MQKPARLSSQLAGVAGEYYVAAELSRRGYIASITLRNTRGIDILASNADGTCSVGIQVKTHKGHQRDWVLNSKIEKQDLADNLYFIFVRLNDHASPPSYHVVRCADVVRYATDGHQEWLASPRRDGRPHKDTAMRKFRDPADEYLDRWDLLGLG